MAMAEEKKYVDADEVARDWGVSKSQAYKIIQKLNRQIREQFPDAIIVSGKVSRAYYNRCCLADADRKAGAVR